MDAMQKGIVILLKSAITGEKLALPADFDIDRAYPVIRAHHVTPLAYTGAVNCGVDREKPAMQQLFQSYCRALQVSQRQMQELTRVFSAFEEQGIDYLPLKGCVMKAFYPQPELRLMGDADVLIRMEQYDRIIPVIQALGFREKAGAEHHFVWQSDNLNLELHRQLMMSVFRKWYNYFQNGWVHAKLQNGTRYVLDDVHTFAFLLTHFTKHYSGAGIGCRHVVDLWVYLRSHPQMDQARLKDVLERMNLWEFYQNVRRLIGVWFEEEVPDEKTEFLTKVIFANGSWGYMKNAMLNRGVRNMGKSDSAARSRLKYIWSCLFPGGTYFRDRYPVLNKQPWLLPVMWCVRLIEKTVMNRAILRRHVGVLRSMNRDELMARKRMLEYVGLNVDE